MHILIIPSWYKTPDNPIRGSFFRDQAQALHKAGHQVGMLVPPSKLRSFHGLREISRHWRKRNDEISIEDDNGVIVYRIPWWGWREAIAVWQRGGMVLRIFDRYCKDMGKPDVLHGHSTIYGGYLAAYIGEQRGIPAVLTEHSSNFQDGYIFPGQGLVTRYTLRHTTRRFAVGLDLAEALNRYAPERKIEVVGNVVDADVFVPSENSLPDRPFVFLMVARLTSCKGHDVLLHAFARAFREQDVQLHIAGTGYTGRKLQRLKTKIAELDLEKHIVVHGVIPRKQMPQLIQKCHAVVSASYTETFGVTLIEAMACGKPVVATRSGGPENFVNDKNGLLIPVGDVDALAAAMREMVNHYDRYDPVQIRAECVARFSESAIIRRLETVYREVTNVDERQPGDA